VPPLPNPHKEKVKTRGCELLCADELTPHDGPNAQPLSPSHESKKKFTSKREICCIVPHSPQLYVVQFSHPFSLLSYLTNQTPPLPYHKSLITPHIPQHEPLRGRRRSCRRSSCRIRRRARRSGDGVVPVEASRLRKLERRELERDVLARHDGTDNERDEEHEERKVEDGVANNAAFAETGLLERVDGRSNLTARTQPEEHDGV